MLSADIDGRADRNKTEKVREIKNLLIGAPKDFLSFDDKVYILDDKRILIGTTEVATQLVESNESESSVSIVEEELERKLVAE